MSRRPAIAPNHPPLVVYPLAGCCTALSMNGWPLGFFIPGVPASNSGLTSDEDLFNNDRATAKSVAGIATPNLSGAQDAPHWYSVFFCAFSLWWTGIGKSSDLAVSLRDGCCNLYQSATLIRLQPNRGELRQQSQETVTMCVSNTLPPATPEECFSVRSECLSGKKFPADAVYTANHRAIALVRALMATSAMNIEDNEFGINHRDMMNALWLLEATLVQADQVMDAWMGIAE